MYISVYPVTVTMRNSNVYEERSLGIYDGDASPPPPPPVSARDKQPRLDRKTSLGMLTRHLTNRLPKESRSYFIRQQLRGQLARLVVDLPGRAVRHHHRDVAIRGRPRHVLGLQRAVRGGLGVRVRRHQRRPAVRLVLVLWVVARAQQTDTVRGDAEGSTSWAAGRDR